ncbi:uncharacterized protein LOC131022249 [Salvia miltiorrhiza]|uniref:uncharacterized protein LOC131022249 n=1 Tax=Salvia miltiorrhiza TaxID=226208 RepID=UPI0025AD6A24|nr:uncharacterized protein LOC131022249 [Salvia miltiorrhiza]
MGMGEYRMESEEEALSRSYPYLLHSPPSTISLPPLTYSSSRGSNNSQLFNHNHKPLKFHHLVVQDEDHHLQDEHRRGWIKYFSLTYSNSGGWILMQLSWRFLVSFMIALLVFYVAAKPPHPDLSLKVAGIRQFRLGEGVDASGVTTKLLSCNFSINLIIDNHSKLFALHIHPPTIKLIFGRLTFAISQMQGRELYAGNDDLTMLRFNVGTRNKAMYGAGRNMQDFLESEKGLPLVIRVSLRSKFNVIWGIIEPKYHHEAQCLVVVDNNYDKKHRTQVYNSTCIIHP